MPIRSNPATTRVPPIRGFAQGFQQKEVAEMLGVPEYRISRDCAAIWPNRFSYVLLNEGQVRTLYCVAMYRHLQYSQGRSQVSMKEIREFLDQETEAIWALVQLAGASLEDCNQGIEEMRIRQNQRQIEQQTINVESTVA